MQLFFIWLARILHTIEQIFDRIKYRHTGKSLIWIQAYRGFGNANKIFIKGRVLESRQVQPAKRDDSLWKNLVNSFHRFESDEIRHARLLVLYAGTELEIQANEEGFYETWLEPGVPVNSSDNQDLQPLEIILLKPVRPEQGPVHSTGTVVLPEPDCPLGIISDIDDTIIHTDVSNPLKTIWNLISNNAYTRQPIPGFSAFYRGLARGISGNQNNPFFYISTSPWNIYDVLDQFLEIRNFPPNPILYLRDWGITQKELVPLEHAEHKTVFILKILDLYPRMKFLLIGDSNQQDAEIYSRIALSHPQRICAIYLREVNPSPDQRERIHRLRAKVARKNIPVILSDSVLQLAEHAASHSWIDQTCLVEVNKDVNNPVKGSTWRSVRL